MSPRTQTLPLDDPRMWRRLVGRAHPDAGGDHELFIWTATVKDVVCGGELQLETKPEPSSTPRRPPPGPTPADDKPRIPYPVGTDFEEATLRALVFAAENGGPYAEVLSLLVSCHPLEHLAYEQKRGACYKRLAAIGHLWVMTKRERTGWYRCAEGIPLSDRHASHILGRLKRQAA